MKPMRRITYDADYGKLTIDLDKLEIDDELDRTKIWEECGRNYNTQRMFYGEFLERMLKIFVEYSETEEIEVEFSYTDFGAQAFITSEGIAIRIDSEDTILVKEDLTIR